MFKMSNWLVYHHIGGLLNILFGNKKSSDTFHIEVFDISSNDGSPERGFV